MIVAEHPTQVPAEIDHDPGIEPITLCLPTEWRLTDQALMAISSLNDAIKFERSEQGALIISFAAGGMSSPMGGKIYRQVDAWADSVGGGQARESSAGYGVGARTVRSPDISWVSREQLASLDKATLRQGFLPICPPFVVEVVSPDDSVAAQKRKMDEWIGFGVQLGWLIDGDRATAWIYRADQDEPESLERPDTLSGEDVLPGLVVDLTYVWSLAEGELPS